jgi:Protein of unknown function (DUF3179)
MVRRKSALLGLGGGLLICGLLVFALSRPQSPGAVPTGEANIKEPDVIGELFSEPLTFTTPTPLPAERALPGFKTNTAKRSVELKDLQSGGPAKDGIPAILNPKFISQAAANWLVPQEPVIALVVENEARAYPLQILIWHEIVNDTIGKTPVTVTFCPLCYSAIVFERRVGDRIYSFGVSGLLRHSDMIMYDRQTETLWQQFNGEALVGDLTGTFLKQLPAQIVSYEQFRQAYPQGVVLSRDTGYNRDYGRNPYAGYDDINQTPFLFKGKTDNRLPPMEKVIAVHLGGKSKAYPYTISRKERIISDKVGGQPLVVFHVEGATSALDNSDITKSRAVGATAVFDPRLSGRFLTFEFAEGKIRDRETGSEWDITGRATGGALQGQQLTSLVHGDYFAFAWLVFRPQTDIYRAEAVPPTTPGKSGSLNPPGAPFPAPQSYP